MQSLFSSYDEQRNQAESFFKSQNSNLNLTNSLLCLCLSPESISPDMFSMIMILLFRYSFLFSDELYNSLFQLFPIIPPNNYTLIQLCMRLIAVQTNNLTRLQILLTYISSNPQYIFFYIWIFHFYILFNKDNNFIFISQISTLLTHSFLDSSYSSEIRIEGSKVFSMFLMNAIQKLSREQIFVLISPNEISCIYDFFHLPLDPILSVIFVNLIPIIDQLFSKEAICDIFMNFIFSTFLLVPLESGPFYELANHSIYYLLDRFQSDYSNIFSNPTFTESLINLCILSQSEIDYLLTNPLSVLSYEDLGDPSVLRKNCVCLLARHPSLQSSKAPEIFIQLASMPDIIHQEAAYYLIEQTLDAIPENLSAPHENNPFLKIRYISMLSVLGKNMHDEIESALNSSNPIVVILASTLIDIPIYHDLVLTSLSALFRLLEQITPSFDEGSIDPKDMALFSELIESVIIHIDDTILDHNPSQLLSTALCLIYHFHRVYEIAKSFVYIISVLGLYDSIKHDVDLTVLNFIVETNINRDAPELFIDILLTVINHYWDEQFSDIIDILRNIFPLFLNTLQSSEIHCQTLISHFSCANFFIKTFSELSIILSIGEWLLKVLTSDDTPLEYSGMLIVRMFIMPPIQTPDKKGIFQEILYNCLCERAENSSNGAALFSIVFSTLMLIDEKGYFTNQFIHSFSEEQIQKIIEPLDDLDPVTWFDAKCISHFLIFTKIGIPIAGRILCPIFSSFIQKYIKQSISLTELENEYLSDESHYLNSDPIFLSHPFLISNDCSIIKWINEFLPDPSLFDAAEKPILTSIRQVCIQS